MSARFNIKKMGKRPSLNQILKLLLLLSFASFSGETGNIIINFREKNFFNVKIFFKNILTLANKETPNLIIFQHFNFYYLFELQSENHITQTQRG